MPASRTTVVLIILALLILGAAAFLLFGQDARTSGISAENAGPAAGAEQVFLDLTAKIDPVELDTSILQDPRFSRLQSLRTTIIPESSGRTDPFAPLSGVSNQQ